MSSFEAAKENSTPADDTSAPILEPEPPTPKLSEEEILRQVDRERGVPTEEESRSTLVAFGVTLVAFIYVCILLMNRADDQAQFAPPPPPTAKVSQSIPATANAPR